MTTAAEGPTWRRLSALMLLVHPVQEVIRAIPWLFGLLIAGSNSGRGGQWGLAGIGIDVYLIARIICGRRTRPGWAVAVAIFLALLAGACSGSGTESVSRGATTTIGTNPRPRPPAEPWLTHGLDLVNSRAFVAAVAFAWLAFITVANVRGIGAGKWIQNAGGISTAVGIGLVFLVFLATGTMPGWEVLEVIPGLALIAVNAFSVSLFLGMLCARFRDIAPIVASLMQLAFFMSPVLWKPELLGEKAVWLPLNPFYTVMETVRGPLVEGGVSALVWLSAILYTLLIGAVALAFFIRFRGRIAFWV